MNFQQPQSSANLGSDIASGPATGSHELSGAGFSASVEGQLSSPADVSSAHSFFTGDGAAQAQLSNVFGSPTDLSAISMAPTGAEAAALNPLAMPGAESQVLAGLVAGANEPISPMIQLILKMPGAMGLLNSFFEFMANFFLNQTTFFDLLNPAFLGANAYTAFSQAIHNIPMSLSLLPSHAPILSSLTSLNGMGNTMFTSDLLSSKLNLSLGAAPSPAAGIKDFASFRTQFNVSGTPSLNRPMFEGVPSASGAGANGVLAGPGMTDIGQANHIAGSTRLFSDKLSGGSINSAITGGSPSATSNLATNVSTTPGSNLVSGNMNGLSASGNFQESILGNGGSVEPAGFSYSNNGTSSMGDMGSAADVGPSGAVSEQLGGNHLLAMDNSAKSFGPTISDAGERLKSAIDPGSAQGAAGEIGGLKAKQLTLDSFNNTAKPSVNAASHAKAASPAAASHSSASNGASASHSSATHAPKHHAAAPKAHAPKAHTQHHKAAAPEAELKQDNRLLAENNPALEGAGSEQMQMMEGGDAASYTIQKGDNLWNLAKQHLGDGTRWQEIYSQNQDILGSNPDLIYPGTEIKLPGQIAEISQNGATSYTVQPGDNLWNISRDHLGQGQSWGEIYQMNQDVIGANPSLIHPGQQLSLPSTDPTGTTLSNAANAQPQLPDAEMTTAPTGDSSMAETMPSPDAGAAAGGEQVDIQSYGQENLQPMQSEAPEVSHEFLQVDSSGQVYQPQISQAKPVGLPVIPANSQPIAAGPGAAQAATINSGNKPVVSSGLLGDLGSLLNNSNK